MINTDTIPLPTYWAPYLINGDESGYETHELKQIGQFFTLYPEYQQILTVDDDSEYCLPPTYLGAADLPAGDYSTYTYVIND